MGLKELKGLAEQWKRTMEEEDEKIERLVERRYTLVSSCKGRLGHRSMSFGRSGGPGCLACR